MIRMIEFAGYVKKKFLDCPISQNWTGRTSSGAAAFREVIRSRIRFRDEYGPYNRILHCYLPFNSRVLRATCHFSYEKPEVAAIKRELAESVIQTAMAIEAAQAIQISNARYAATGV